MTAEPTEAAGIENIDAATVTGFGEEWRAFDQADLDEGDTKALFHRYFSLLDHLHTWQPGQALDVGCGSGRFARLVAPRCGHLIAVDAAPAALEVAKRNLAGIPNVTCHFASVADLPVPDESCDLVYSLGVLHHVPDTAGAIKSCAAKVAPGGYLLLYLYYRFDHRPRWFRSVWKASDALRQGIARLPFPLRRRLTDIIAVLVYWPLARLVRAVERRGRNAQGLPLYFYRDSSLYSMRTDALDRFGTRLERRFTRPEIEQMLQQAGMVDIRFRDGEPYWCVVATKPLTPRA